MKIKINSEHLDTPTDDMTVSDMIEWRSVKPIGTAVAVNGSLVNRSKWDIHKLQPNDDVVIISAAFGG